MTSPEPVPAEHEAAPAQAAKQAAAREWKIDYLAPAGEPSLVPPDSVQWRVYRNSPAWQAALRLGLPGDFSWRSPSAQQSLLKSATITPRAA